MVVIDRRDCRAIVPRGSACHRTSGRPVRSPSASSALRLRALERAAGIARFAGADLRRIAVAFMISLLQPVLIILSYRLKKKCGQVAVSALERLPLARSCDGPFESALSRSLQT
jgi:hypothetical protein